MEEIELTDMEVLRILCPGMSDLELQALMCPELAWVWEILFKMSDDTSWED